MGRKASECVYPYGELSVGDSFVVDDCKLEKLCYLNRRFGKLLGLRSARFDIKTKCKTCLVECDDSSCGYRRT